MLNQFLFKRQGASCDFDFDNLHTLSAERADAVGARVAGKLHSADERDRQEFHAVLNRILNASYEHRPTPALDVAWQAQLVESRMIDAWLRAERERARSTWRLPNEGELLRDWFDQFIDAHAASRHPLFRFLAEEATARQLAYYIFQENPSDANFEDLIVSLQLGIGNPNSKMELARNYWDEMGLGDIRLVHTELYNEFLTEVRGLVPEFDSHFEALPEAIATGNYLLYACKYRSTRYLGLGCLGVIERLFSEASETVVKACVRLGIKTQLYHRTHCAIDLEHTDRWSTHLFDEIERDGPVAAEEIALGAILRLNIIGAMYDRILAQFRAGAYR